MPNPRERRLQADYQKVLLLIKESGGTLRLVDVHGTPPTKYTIEYHCPSLVKQSGGQVTVRGVHRVEIELGTDYPMDKPRARMLTPVFNPHVFETSHICLGGRWKATESLDTLILRIGAILQLDPRIIDYNSLANHSAGKFVRDNKVQLPLTGAVSFKAPKIG